MSNQVMNAHIAYGSPCGDDAGLAEVADWAGSLLLGSIEDSVVVKRSKYEELGKKEDWLNCLEWAGVGNWDGLSYDCEI